MLKKFLISSLLLVTVNASAAFIGFTPSNNFSLETYRGEVSVQCRPSSSTADWDCEGEFFNHIEMEYFHHPSKEATSFSLVAHHADGSKTEKSGKFIGAEGRSENRVNLWVRTVFQEPLLKLGENKIEYTLSNGQNVVATGEFNVSVQNSSETSYTCPWDSMYDQDRSLCEEPRRACENYFFNVFRRCKAD